MAKTVRLRHRTTERTPFQITGRVFREAWLSVKRNGAFSIACVIVSGISFLTLGLFLLLDGSVNNMVSGLEDKVGISAYLSPTVTPSDVAWLQSRIISWPEVEAVKYVSSEEAMQTLKEDLAEFTDVLSTLPANPLPSSLEIKPKTPDQTEAIVSQLRNLPQVEDIQYDMQTVSRLIIFARYFRLLGVFVSLLFLLSAWFLLSSSLRMTVYARRMEIEIMRLVGATSNYIRYPFILEGIIYGLTGAAIACLLLIPIYSVLASSFSRFSFLAYLAPTRNFLFLVIICLLVLGSLLGAFAANISVRRFLKE